MAGSRAAAIGVLALVTFGCGAPRLRPLSGDPAPARLPAIGLEPGHRKVVFRWELQDPELVARGEGAARIAAPDSVRLDFFLAGGMGSGAAVLLGDQVRSPAPELVDRLVPPPPLLWAALGRLAVPALPDTVVRVEGGLLRADIGRPVAWRLTLRGDTLTRLERVSEGRLVEWVDRPTPDRIRYRHEGARRELTLTLSRTEDAAPFDATIWRF